MLPSTSYWFRYYKITVLLFLNRNYSLFNSITTYQDISFILHIQRHSIEQFVFKYEIILYLITNNQIVIIDKHNSNFWILTFWERTIFIGIGCTIVHILEVHHSILRRHWRKRNSTFGRSTRPGAEEWKQFILLLDTKYSVSSTLTSSLLSL